jgi:hypothetical protein
MSHSHHPHLHGPTLQESMDKGRAEREAAGAALAAEAAAHNPHPANVKPEEFPSEGFTGRTMGWTVAEYSVGDKWRWWARFNSTAIDVVANVVTGHANTWAEAVGAAKKAYDELEELAQ